MLLPCFLVCFLTFITTTVGQAHPNKSACVPTFWSRQHDFDVCRVNLCFLFKEEQPYVFTTTKLAAEPSHPFPCRDREHLYPGLHGVFFDVLDRVARREHSADPSVRNAQCVYVSNECSFDDEVEFVKYAVESGKSYKFIAGGHLMFSHNRRHTTILPSAQIFGDSMVLMHRRNSNTHSFRAAVKNVLEPFKPTSWAVGASFAALIALVVAVYVYWFSGVTYYDEPDAVTWLLSGVPGVNSEQQAAWYLLVLSFTVYATVVILLYELAAALAIFKGPEPLVKGLAQLESLGLSKFGVLKEAASELVLRITVDKQGKLNDSSIPWERMSAFREMVSRLLDKKIDFALTFEKKVKFQLHRLNLCDRVSVTPLNLPTVGGWFYSANIPTRVTTTTNTILLRDWMEQEVEKDLIRYGGVPIDCGVSTTTVDHSVLIIMLGLTAAPLLLLTIGFMVKAKYFPAATQQVEGESGSGEET